MNFQPNFQPPFNEGRQPELADILCKNLEHNDASMRGDAAKLLKWINEDILGAPPQEGIASRHGRRLAGVFLSSLLHAVFFVPPIAPVVLLGLYQEGYLSRRSAILIGVGCVLVGLFTQFVLPTVAQIMDRTMKDLRTGFKTAAGR